MFRWALAIMSIVSIASNAVAAATPDLIGNWARVDGSARIQIEQCGPKFCATNTWIRDPSSGEVVGDKLEMKLDPQSNNGFGGEAFDQKRDKTYAMHITIQQTNTMTTRGCILIGMLCKTESWNRIQ